MVAYCVLLAYYVVSLAYIITHYIQPCAHVAILLSYDHNDAWYHILISSLYSSLLALLSYTTTWGRCIYIILLVPKPSPCIIHCPVIPDSQWLLHCCKHSSISFPHSPRVTYSNSSPIPNLCPSAPISLPSTSAQNVNCKNFDNLCRKEAEKIASLSTFPLTTVCLSGLQRAEIARLWWLLLIR